jgi:hypothetical protein
MIQKLSRVLTGITGKREDFKSHAKEGVANISQVEV